MRGREFSASDHLSKSASHGVHNVRKENYDENYYCSRTQQMYYESVGGMHYSYMNQEEILHEYDTA